MSEDEGLENDSGDDREQEGMTRGEENTGAPCLCLHSIRMQPGIDDETGV